MEFRILGPLEVHSDAGPVALGGDKRRALLGLLLLHANQPVGVEGIAVALWGEDAPADAVKTVRVHVSRTRAALGDPDALATTPAGYQLRVRDGELDADRFEELLERGRSAQADGDHDRSAALLREALALWRGPALSDLRYELFAQSEIARLEELRWDAIEALNDANLGLGRIEAVLAERGGAPLRERLIEQRMRALYRAGRHVDALAVYREARRRLDEELGLQPGPALRELEQAILAHEATLAPRATPTAVSAPPTPTVGRDDEVRAVREALVQSRLVTLTGPGGVGKTRIAIEAARALDGQFADGVRVAWLAAVSAAAEVPAALTRAVAVVPQAGEAAEDALVRRLSGAAMLLLVDNVEHVLDAAPLLADLLAACPGLQVLATGREPLRLRGERCLPVAPLSVADGIGLFVARARDRRPDFEVTAENAPAIEDLCRRLDGLPLALELAAGRIGLLEPAELAVRLTDALPLLEGGPRDAPARQRTIRATLEWSVGLLRPDEREWFLRLAVFVGGADVDAANTVTEAPLGGLDALVTKNLVRRRDGRLAQLEVVRQFAAAAFTESRERDLVRRRHAEYYLQLAERLGPEARVTGHGAALRQIERELGNLRAALDYWLARDDGDRALRLTAAAEPYWFLSNHHRDGLKALDDALRLQAGASERTRGRALVARSLLRRRLDSDGSQSDAVAGLELARAAGDIEGQCMALDTLAYQLSFHGDAAAAVALAAEERALADQLGDPYHLAMAVMRQAWAEPGLRRTREFAEQAVPLLRRCGSLYRVAEMMSDSAMCAFDEGNFVEAERIATEALEAAERAGDPWVLTASLGNAGLAALFLEHFDEAEGRFREQLAMCRRERLETRWAEPTLGLAVVAAKAGLHERAAVLGAAAEASLREHASEPDLVVFVRLISRYIEPVASELGDHAWAAAVARGRALTQDEIYALALDAGGP